MKKTISTRSLRQLAQGAAWFCGLAALPVIGFAQDDTAAWRSQLTPYLWAAGAGGKLRPLYLSPTVDFSASFGEALKDLTAAAFVTGTARRDRLVLLGDISYINLSKGVQVAPGLELVGKVRQTAATLEAGYQLLDDPGLTMDLLAGIRAWDLRVAVQAPAFGLRTSPGVSFVDPVLAIRFNKVFAPRWSAVVYADVGGFGVGSRSTWQVVGTLNYSLGHDFYASAGYRYLSLDYREKGTLIDIALHGPLLGLTWRF